MSGATFQVVNRSTALHSPALHSPASTITTHVPPPSRLLCLHCHRSSGAFFTLTAFILCSDALSVTVCRSKKSLELDISLAEDRKTFLSLLRTADVFLTNVPTHSQAHLGIVAEKLQQQNPGLIVAQIQSWGNGGPMERQPG